MCATGGESSLARFARAQEPLIGQVLDELRAGRKTSHWMWFIFPQIRGLGRSATARFYAIASLAEAEAYLRDPVLGARLRECTRLVNEITERQIADIFGDPDDLKFRSCMTLFARAAKQMPPAADNGVFRDALAKYFGGAEDLRTLGLIESGGARSEDR